MPGGKVDADAIARRFNEAAGADPADAPCTVVLLGFRGKASMRPRGRPRGCLLEPVRGLSPRVRASMRPRGQTPRMRAAM